MKELYRNILLLDSLCIYEGTSKSWTAVLNVVKDNIHSVLMGDCLKMAEPLSDNLSTMDAASARIFGDMKPSDAVEEQLTFFY